MSVELSFCRVLTSHFAFDYCQTSNAIAVQSALVYMFQWKIACQNQSDEFECLLRCWEFDFILSCLRIKKNANETEGNILKNSRLKHWGAAVYFTNWCIVVAVYLLLADHIAWCIHVYCVHINVWKYICTGYTLQIYIATEMSMNSKVIWRMWQQDGSNIYNSYVKPFQFETELKIVKTSHAHMPFRYLCMYSYNPCLGCHFSQCWYRSSYWRATIIFRKSTDWRFNYQCQNHVCVGIGLWLNKTIGN